MKPLTWSDIILTEKGLKQYREENNIVVPEGYIISTRRLATYACLISFIFGATVIMLLYTILKIIEVI